MGTWEPGVPYTDPEPDQVTDEVNADRTAQAEAEAGLGIADLDPVPVVDGTRLHPDAVVPIEQDGVTAQVTIQQLAGFLWGVDNGRSISESGAITAEDTAVSSGASSGINLAVCALTDDQLAGHQPVKVVQGGTGPVTITNGTNATVLTTGTGRAKTRAQFSMVWLFPLLNSAGVTYWTVFGDTANA